MKKENIIDWKGHALHIDVEKIKIEDHQMHVKHLIGSYTYELERRGNIHDQDKMVNVEKWARFQLLDKAGYKFGTPEHKEFKKSLNLREVIDNHTDNNRHHPEFFKNDLSKMNLLDVTEMIIDWYSASTTRASGKGVDFANMMDYQQTRFNMSDELKSILLNTLNKLTELEKGSK